jgi:hypothetical protein
MNWRRSFSHDHTDMRCVIMNAASARGENALSGGDYDGDAMTARPARKPPAGLSISPRLYRNPSKRAM